MTLLMDKLTDTFRIEDTDGNIYVVYEYTAQIDASTKGNPGVVRDGLKTLRTATGLHVNYISDTEYEIPELDDIKAHRI